MSVLSSVLIWVLEIGGAVIILTGALLWLKAAVKGQSTARSFMALVFTFIFFIAVVLRNDEFAAATLHWLTAVYGAMLAFYIVARMVEHREEIRAGRESRRDRASE